MTDLLPPSYSYLLTASTRLDDAGLAAYRRWRATVPLDDAPYIAHRVMPQLVELAQRHGIDDPDIARMRGVERHVWASNMMRFKALFAALAALEATGVRPLMLKGAALMARDPRMAQKQRSADYDILIRPTQLRQAATALKAAGFTPAGGYNWDNLDDEQAERIAGGVAIWLPETRSEIDLHWQPLWNNHDPALAELLIDAGETAELQGHPVLVPQAAHQLFLALARCEPWDAEECFRRLLEGHQLLALAGSYIDWDALLGLVSRYRLEAVAAAYLGTLRDLTDAAIPDRVLETLRPNRREAKEWAIRAVPPPERTIPQLRFIARQDLAAGRAAPGTVPPAWFEAAIRQHWPGRPPLRLLWWLAKQRYRGPSTGRPRFLEGFWYPEAEGRWTQSGWAVVAVPGADGGVARLDADLFLGPRERVRIGVAGGGRPFLQRVERNDTEIAIPVEPVPELGGDGLLLLWTPDAPSPSEAGSDDKRQLGLFLRYRWRR
jgi:hypothetical protein